MKKIIYISFAVVALGLGSCSKSEIVPVSDSETEVPVWKSNNSEITDPELGGSDLEITDPNSDPELETSGT
jgi:hypothetical protein